MIMISDLTTTRHMKMCNHISFSECGIEYCSPGHYNGPQKRFYCLIHFVLEGKGELQVDNKKYIAKTGDAFLIPSNINGYYIADANEPWKYCWISFVGTMAEKYVEEIFGENNYIIKTECNQKIKNIFLNIARKYYIGKDTEKDNWLSSYESHLYAANSTTEMFELNSAMFSIMALLIKKTKNKKEDLLQINYAEEIKKYIDESFLDINDISKISEEFHFHPNYLSNIFKEKYKISPKKYLIRRKLLYANHLLMETNYSIRYISSVCGFSTVSAFSKTYRRYNGITPGMYRNLRSK